MDHVSSSIYDLLEDYWFFENLFTRKSTGLRYCHSDPYPSSSLSSAENTPSREDRSQKKLRRQISEKIRVEEPRQLESYLQGKEQHVVLPKSGSRSAPGKIQDGSTKRGLTRIPSLPPQIQKSEMDREAKKMISKLTRQFSEKIRVLEPTRPSGSFLHKKETMVRDKYMTERNKTRGSYSTSSSVKIGLQRTQTMPHTIGREEEDEFEDQESDSRMGFLIREALASSHNPPKVSKNQRQRPPKSLISENTVMVKQESSSPKTLRKTLSSIETTKQIQRLRDYDDDQLVKPHVTTPPRVPKDSRKEMKDQIKFWARAVASNVRQEC